MYSGFLQELRVTEPPHATDGNSIGVPKSVSSVGQVPGLYLFLF